MKVGIGIITYNRYQRLQATLKSVLSYTNPAHQLLVCDDGSTDDTIGVCQENRVNAISGKNHGIAWNKNRALFQLMMVQKCDAVILLEDDTNPTCQSWEEPWVDAVQRWGHVNHWSSSREEHDISGVGTAADPVRSQFVTAQCSAFSREALSYVGFFDSRLRWYGHEHVEHSLRLLRAGYGGEYIDDLGAAFYLLKSAIEIHDEASWGTADGIAGNMAVVEEIRYEPVHRWPWRSDEEMREFRSEQTSLIVP